MIVVVAFTWYIDSNGGSNVRNGSSGCCSIALILNRSIINIDSCWCSIDRCFRGGINSIYSNSKGTSRVVIVMAPV